MPDDLIRFPAERTRPPLQPTGGGGTSDGMDDQWKASVETRFDRVDSRFDRVEGKLDRIESDMRQIHYWILGSAAATVIAIGAIVFSMETFKSDMFSAALQFIQANQTK